MIDYLAPQPLNMQPIASPFVGDWNIDQVFQMEMCCGQQPNAAHQFAYGYYDNVQNNFVLQLTGNGEDKFYTANGQATLRYLLDLVYGANAAYEFTQKFVTEGNPLPEDDNVLLDLFLEDLYHASIDVTVWGGNFNEEALAQAQAQAQHWAQGHAPPPPIVIPQLPPLPSQEEFNDEPVEEQPVIEQPLQLPQALPVLPMPPLPPIEQPLLQALPPIEQPGLYYDNDPLSDNEDPVSDEEDGPIS